MENYHQPMNHNRMPGPHRSRTMVLSKYVTTSLLAITLFSCAAAGPRPLSITMFHPEKNTTLDCAARDLGRADRDTLADTVEACARQLERSGFVRQSSKP